MKKVIFLVILLFSTASIGSAQIAVPIKKGGTLPATCVTTDTQTLLFYKTGANNGLYFCSATNTWTLLANTATGYTVGPASSTDNAILRFDGTTGKLTQNSPVTIADTTGAIAGTQSVTMSGATSGTLMVKPAATAGTNTLTLPAGTTDFSATGGTSQVVQQTTSGGALTVGQLAASNLSNGTTGSGSVVLATSPALTTPNLGTPSTATLTNATGLPLTTGVTGTLPVANGGTGVTSSTGSGNNVLSNSPTLVTPALGTPSSGVATNLTGLPLTSGVTGTLPVANGGTNASSAGITAFNNITGYSASGATGTTSTNLVFSTSPTLTTPNLGTPSSATLTNATGLPISTGVSGLAAGVATTLGTPSSANLATAVTDETGSGSLVFATSPSLTTPNLGTPSAATLTNATGLPISTGVSGLGTGVATFLGTPSSANLASAVTNETGSGNLVFATSPTLVTPALGTPSSGVATNLTGLPLTTGVTGTLPVANGGTGVTSSTGSGNVVLSTSPTLTTPNLGTPSAVTLTNATGLPVSGITASTSTALGVGAVELGHATDTTVSRSSAGNIAVEGNVVYRAGGTDVPVTDGGTGASDAATARTNLGAAAATHTHTSGDVTRTLVTSSSNLTPAAGDKGTHYLGGHFTFVRTLTLPASAGCVAGETHFYLSINVSGSSMKIVPNGADLIDFYSDVRATLYLDQTIAKVTGYAHILYVGGGKWRVIGNGLDQV